MTSLKDHTQDTIDREHWRAIVRFVLGIAQMAGALLSLLLFVGTGFSRQTLTAAAGTGLLTGVTLWVFRTHTDPDKEMTTKTHAKRS
jgi:hypothetical protein